MATLTKLIESGALVSIDPGLEQNEFEVRRLVGTGEFVTWLDEQLPTLVVEDDPFRGDLTPLEQVAAMFTQYVLGEPFSSDRRFRKLKWTPQHHVWELKTDDVRIFGWVPAKDTFVCCFGDLKNTIMELNRYGLYIAKTKYVRDQLDLDAPKCIEGKEYSDVISTED